MTVISATFDLENFKLNPEKFTLIDVRNQTEINDGKIFSQSLTIPLPELRERLDEIPSDKPIVVHCAAGYRSAAGSSIIAGKITNVPVYDMGEAIAEFASALLH